MKNYISKLFTILFVFATTTLLAQEETTITTTKISVEVKANSTDKELKEMATLFKKKKIDLKFKKIERNHKGEIIGISSSYKGPNGFKGNYNFSGPVPIKPFNFSVQFDGNDAISSIDYEKSKMGDIIAMHTNNNVEKNIHFKVGQNNGRLAKTLFIVDGKEMSNLDAIDVDPNNIKSVSVLKNSSATTKYGEKGANGVVEITTKNNIKTDNPLFIVDGKIMSNDFDAESLDPNTLESMSVSTDRNGSKKKYGEKAKNGVVKITTKKNVILKLDDKEEDLGVIKPLIIIDGKEMIHSFGLESLKPDTIESMSVLKGKSATETYGEKGKNGVIIIKLKKK